LEKGGSGVLEDVALPLRHQEHAPPRRPENSLFNGGILASPAAHAPQSASTVKDDEADEIDALFQHDQALPSFVGINLLGVQVLDQDDDDDDYAPDKNDDGDKDTLDASEGNQNSTAVLVHIGHHGQVEELLDVERLEQELGEELGEELRDELGEDDPEPEGVYINEKTQKPFKGRYILKNFRQFTSLCLVRGLLTISRRSQRRCFGSSRPRKPSYRPTVETMSTVETSRRTMRLFGESQSTNV
jgi:hypothetical protein